MYALEAQLGYNSGSILNSHVHETWLVPANPPECSGVAMLALLETIWSCTASTLRFILDLCITDKQSFYYDGSDKGTQIEHKITHWWQGDNSYVQGKRVHRAIPRLALPKWQLQAAVASGSSCNALCWWVGQFTEHAFSSRWKGLSEAFRGPGSRSLRDEEAFLWETFEYAFSRVICFINSRVLSYKSCLIHKCDSWSDYECMLLASLDKFIKYF